MAFQYYTACSLDGFIATPDHSLDWLLQLDSGGGASYDAFIRDVGALAMGSHTYEWLLRHLAKTGEAWPYTLPSWVFSSRELPRVEGDVRFVRGFVADHAPAMVEAAQGKHVWIVGGGELVGQFHDAGMLDDVIVTFAPVTLGAGMPLLPREIAFPPMELVATQQHGQMVEMRMRVRRA